MTALDIGRMQLMSYVITLQQSIIALLSDATQEEPTNLNLAALLTTSNDIRAGCVRALVDQYQRMTAAAPVLPNSSSGFRALLGRRSRNVINTRLLKPNYCSGTQASIDAIDRYIHCKYCKYTNKPLSLHYETKKVTPLVL